MCYCGRYVLRRCSSYRTYKHQTNSHSVLCMSQGRQCAYNGLLRRVRLPLLPWESNKHYMFWLCVCSLSYPAWKAHAPYLFQENPSSCNRVVTCGPTDGRTDRQTRRSKQSLFVVLRKRPKPVLSYCYSDWICDRRCKASNFPRILSQPRYIVALCSICLNTYVIEIT
jgi:hypothetical protein